MSKARAVISLPAGRKIKWVILAFWVVLVLVAGPLAGKLTGAEKNDAHSWLPANAESTKVLDFQSKFQSPNLFPAVVVYDAPSGLTPAERAKVAADVTAFPGVPGVGAGQVAGPF
jgi:RND superfamily putative drug exporter